MATAASSPAWAALKPLIPSSVCTSTRTISRLGWLRPRAQAGWNGADSGKSTTREITLVIRIVLALHPTAEGEGAAEVAGHDQVQDDHWQGEQQRVGGDLPGGEQAVGAEEVQDRHRPHLMLRAADQDERGDEGAPGVDEGVDRRDRDPRQQIGRAS